MTAVYLLCVLVALLLSAGASLMVFAVLGSILDPDVRSSLGIGRDRGEPRKP